MVTVACEAVMASVWPCLPRRGRPAQRPPLDVTVTFTNNNEPQYSHPDVWSFTA